MVGSMSGAVLKTSSTFNAAGAHKNCECRSNQTHLQKFESSTALVSVFGSDLVVTILTKGAAAASGRVRFFAKKTGTQRL